MAHRGSRGGSRGGRGEALRKFLQDLSESRVDEELPQQHVPEQRDFGVQGSSSQVTKKMGRSAALIKLLETSKPSDSESSPGISKRESLPSRGSSRYPEEGTSRQSLPSRGSYSQEESMAPSYPSSNRGRMRLPERDTSLSTREAAYSSRMAQIVGDRDYDSRDEPRERISERLAHLGVEESISELSLGSSSDTPAVIKKGTYGKEVRMAANYIRLSIEEGKGVFQYDVKFSPEVDSLQVRFKLMKNLMDIIGETKSFDGSILYLPFRLPDKVTTSHLQMPTDDSNVTVKITFVKQLRMGDQQTIHLYNVLFRRIMNTLGLVLHGKHFFDPMSAMPVPVHKLEVWPGFITAIHEYEGGIMLCCDASHRVLRTQTVLQLMQDLISIDSNNWKNEFIKLMVGQTVITRYNNQLYRVDDISFDECPNDTFTRNDGSKVKYSAYYYQHYNIKIQDTNQPLLKSRVKGKIKGKEKIDLVSLVPELCYLSGLTESMRADLRVMKDIAQCTRISPNQRQYALNEFIKNINSNAEVKKILSSWGLKLAENNIKLTGRLIPPEDVYFGNKGIHKGSLSAEWTRAATSSSVLSAVDLTNWSVLCTSRDEQVVNSFIDMLKKSAPVLGLKVTNPKMFKLQNDNTQNYIKVLQQTKQDNFQIVVIVFPLSRVDKYSAVKRWCCVDSPIPSQVILTRTIRKPDKLRSITQKIALQMNCKLGGALWTVDIPLKCAMVIGLDTYHDADRNSKSVGAIVASLNKPLTRWYSKVFTQSPGLEMIDGLEVSFLACIQKYKQINGVYPEQIIVYRDGVGDGQLPVVQEYEIPQIITACRRISPSYEPKFLFVIVQKRINTRLFTEERSEYVNPAPGSVMDHTITRKEYWDFFLVSQSVRQGTVSPTHYVVLHNTTKMSPDQIQRFSYKLTHLYYNWSGTVRVPAPCQYAHKLAYLVGESLHKEAAESLADKLFFL